MPVSDLVERLERFAKDGAGVAVLIDAAEEIKRLRLEKLEAVEVVKRLRAILHYDEPLALWTDDFLGRVERGEQP